MSYLNHGVDLNIGSDIDYSSGDDGVLEQAISEPDLSRFSPIIGGDVERVSSSLPNLSSHGLVEYLGVVGGRDALFNRVFPTSLQGTDASESGDWVDIGAINSEHRVMEELHNSGWFAPSSYKDHFKKAFYDTGFWLGLIFSSLKQYEPALGFFIEHINVEAYNPATAYWTCMLLSFPCAFSQAGLVIQGKKDYANKNRKIELATVQAIETDQPELASSNVRNIGSYFLKSRYLIYLISFTGVISQSYWIGAQLWTLPYFQKKLGFKENMQKYFYNYELGWERFAATLFVTLFGAIGYWRQMIHYSSILMGNIRASCYASKVDENLLKKRKLFAKYVMDVRRAGKLFFDNATISNKHILAKVIPADVIWFDEKFADYVQDFFELLFDGDLIDHSKKYRFKVAEVETSVFSAFFKKYILSCYKKLNLKFADYKCFRYGIIYPLATIGLYQNLFGFKTPFSNIPGMDNFLSQHKGGEKTFEVLAWSLGFLSLFNHISFNIEGLEALAVVKADLVRIEAGLLSSIDPMQRVRVGSYYQINDGMSDQVRSFHDCRRKFNSVIQALANIWLVSVTVLAAIFTALVSTKDSPFPEDNKSLVSAWFVFSVLVVISQIVSQVTTKGEKAMKFVKYLALEFGAVDKLKRPLNQRVMDSERSIYEQTYKFYNKLRELDGQDVLTQGYEDLTLGELVTKIKEFYLDDSSISLDIVEQVIGSIQQGGSSVPVQMQGAFASAQIGSSDDKAGMSLLMQESLL
jgi:hypothetical protein